MATKSTRMHKKDQSILQQVTEETESLTINLRSLCYLL